MLEDFGPGLYVAHGPTVRFLTVPYPTRMVVVRLANGNVWVWSPVALTREIEAAVSSIGPVREIVSPNKIHHLFLEEWAERWPEARLHAPPGLARRKPELHFDTELGDEADPAWASEIDQTVFRGSLALEEVAFFHRPSRTAILCDLVQRLDPAQVSGLRGAVLRLNGLVGEHGSTPREWRATFLRRGPARAARKHILAWEPEQLVIAHGACAREGAGQILSRALAWL